MHRASIAVLVAILLGGTALAVAGCGSKSAAAPAPAQPSQGPPAAAPHPQAVSASLRATLLTTKNCDWLYNVAKTFSAAVNGSEQGNLDKTVAVLQEFAARSPSDIRPDFAVLAQASAKISSALKGLHLSATAVPSQATLDRMTKLSDELDMARVSAASTNITIWASKNCADYLLPPAQTPTPPQGG